MRMIAAVFAMLTLWSCRPAPAPMKLLTVRDSVWKRTVPIYITETKREESWQLPPTSAEIRRAEKQSGTKRVSAGYGPGVCVDFELRTSFCMKEQFRTVPVFSTWYTYEIDRRRIARTEQLSGTDHNPRWPLVILGNREDEGGRAETFLVHLTDSEGAVFSWQTGDFTQWLRLQPGERHRATVALDTKTVLAFYSSALN